MASDAERRNVLLLLVADGMKLAGICTAIGLAVAVVLRKIMTTLPFGVGPTTLSDAFTFAAVSICALAVALLACYIPPDARRRWIRWLLFATMSHRTPKLQTRCDGDEAL